jgi:hypothetical protein
VYLPFSTLWLSATEIGPHYPNNRAWRWRRRSEMAKVNRSATDYLILSSAEMTLP